MARIRTKWLHVGDVGSEIFLATDSDDFDGDLTGAGTLKIRYRKPGGSDGQFNGNGQAVQRTMDGVSRWGIRIITQSGEVDEEGQWQLQPHVTSFNGFTGAGVSTYLTVKPALPGS